MGYPVDNTTKDTSRNIARLDAHAATDAGDVVDIDGQNWTGEDLRASVAGSLSFTTRHTVMLRKVTKRDVALMLAAHGASQFTVEQHARAIAKLLREDTARHTWGAGI